MSGRAEGSLIGTAQTMQQVALMFESLLKVPVIDATGLKGNYNYSASSKLHESEAVFELAHQLGLELTPEDRPTEMLVVQKIE